MAGPALSVQICTVRRGTSGHALLGRRPGRFTAHRRSNGKGVDVRHEVVNLLVEKIASDRHSSVPMMNLVEELLAPDDVPAYVGVLMAKVKTEKYPSYSMIRRLMGLTS
jgi:hypothetical protein